MRTSTFLAIKSPKPVLKLQNRFRKIKSPQLYLSTYNEAKLITDDVRRGILYHRNNQYKNLTKNVNHLYVQHIDVNPQNSVLATVIENMKLFYFFVGNEK